MALFKRDYNKPGPGVPKNAPQKRGFGRFFEIVGRDFGNIFKLNLLVQLCWLPAQVLFLFAVLSFMAGGAQQFILFGVLAAVASIPVGPAYTAQSYILTKMLRDDPGFVWHDFKKAFKQNFKLSVVPGILYSVLAGSQILGGVYYIYLAAEASSFLMLALFALSVIFFAMISPYFFAQAPYLDLRAGPMLKNSLLLAIGNAPRSLAGGLIALVLVLAQLIVFPLTLPLTVAVGYSLPMLINLMWIWPMVDKTFKINETLKQREANRLDAELNDASEEESGEEE